MLPRSANAQRYAHDPQPVRLEDISTPDNLRKLRRLLALNLQRSAAAG